MSVDTTGAASQSESAETTPPDAGAPSEPWWKRAPQAPPPRWASPAAVRRLRLQQTVLPARLKARAEPPEPAS